MVERLPGRDGERYPADGPAFECARNAAGLDLLGLGAASDSSGTKGAFFGVGFTSGGGRTEAWCDAHTDRELLGIKGWAERGTIPRPTD